MTKLHSHQLQAFIDALKQAHDQDERNALWEHIKTPLMEGLDDQSERCLVTFLYRLPESQQSNHAVYLSGSITDWPYSPNSELTWVPDTDLGYFSIAVPKTLRTTYTFVHLAKTLQIPEPASEDPIEPSFYPIPIGQTKLAEDRFSKLLHEKQIEPDPRNPSKFIYYNDLDDPTNIFHQESILECPCAPNTGYIPYAWEAMKAKRDTLKQEDRLIAKSLVLNHAHRSYWIYLPPDYDKKAAQPYPLMLFLDGITYLDPVPFMLDDLIKNHALQPCIAVFLDDAHENRWHEYGCNDNFARFLAHDFLTTLQQEAKLNITDNPALNTIVGSSASGLAAWHAVLTQPTHFGNAIAQSPSMETKNPEEIEQLIEKTCQQNTSSLFLLEVGSLETTPHDLLFQDGTIQSISPVQAVSHTVEVMKRKSLRVQQSQFIGGHNYVCWHASLPKHFQTLFQCKQPTPQFKK